MLKHCIANTSLGLQSGDTSRKMFPWLNICRMKTIAIWKCHLTGGRGGGRAQEEDVDCD